jgi:hypothetical protein
MRAEEILPDHIDRAKINGVLVRKGTVAAFLVNCRIFLDPAAGATRRDEAEVLMVEALPALNALGLFEVFTARAPALRAFVVQHLSPDLTAILPDAK